jgi:DNA (cytosine-5)-methyltransferase 1
MVVQATTYSTPAIGVLRTDEVSSCITKNTGGGGETQNPAFVVQPIALQDITPREKAQNGRGWNDDGTSYTVDTHATQGVAQPIAFHPTQDPISSTDGSTHAMGCGSSTGQASIAIAQPIPINSMNAFRSPDADPTTGCGIGEAGEAMFTITKTNSHAVAQPVNIYGGNKRQDRPEGGFYVRMDEDTTKTLDAASGLNPTCAQGGTAVMQPIIGGVDYENNAHGPDDVTGPLLKGSPTGGGRPLPAIALQSMAVRRLTPVECSRLQGFPDDYLSQVPWRGKPTPPDGPMYKALGNSWAVPNVRWIGKRIQEALDALP